MGKFKSKILFMILTCLLLAGIILLCGFSIAKSEGSVLTQNNDGLFEICREYTQSFTLYGQIEDSGNLISQYEEYVNNRFDVTNKNNNNAFITDEWITKIVPIEVFQARVKDFLYIGEKYGFYVDYDIESEVFLVYILQHSINNDVSGTFVRTIYPLYYEQYQFLPNTDSLQLRYITNGNQKYYEKYSDFVNIYIKDVGFRGHLFNETHINQGENGYVDDADMGGYFIGNSYKFKGVSTQSGKTDFYADVFKTLIGYIPLGEIFSVGDILSVADLLESFNQSAEECKRDFREEISNENQYGFTMGEIYPDYQIEKYGHLMKATESKLETDNSENAILFGTNGSYVQSSVYINYRDHDSRWNTQFAGIINLDVVKEIPTASGSYVVDLATDIESNALTYSFDNEEVTTVQEGEQKEIYVLNGTQHELEFIAPVGGIFTIETQGNTPNRIVSEKELDEVSSDGVNQTVTVNLKKGDMFNFYLEKTDDSAQRIIKLIIDFTPDMIGIGQTKSLTVEAGESEYLKIDNNLVAWFDFDVTCNNPIELRFADSHYNNLETESIVGAGFSDSYMIDSFGTRYMVFTNTSQDDQLVTVSLSGVEQIGIFENKTSTINNRKIYQFCSELSLGIKAILSNNETVLMRVYDNARGLVAFTDRLEQNELLWQVAAEENYYIELENVTNAAATVEFETQPYAESVKLGNNVKTKTNAGKLFTIGPFDTDFEFIVQCNLAYTIYNSTLNEQEAIDGKYSVQSTQKYYIYVYGDNESIALDISPDCSTAMSGIYENTSLFIEYTPLNSAVYVVEGVEDFQWYSEQMMLSGSYLTEGRKYYLKISGDIGEEYDIDIQTYATPLLPDIGMSIGAGKYSFYIENSGDYVLWIMCPPSMSTSVTLTNEQGEYGIDHECLVNQSKQIYMTEGVYILDLEIYSGSSVSILLSTVIK